MKQNPYKQLLFLYTKHKHLYVVEIFILNIYIICKTKETTIFIGF